jgi:hypothetical protein
MIEFRLRLQLTEALGPVNRWFCSQAHGWEVDDPEVLVAYYIKFGGAADFARRFSHATGTVNRWYCSEFYRRDIRDPEILWDYYVKHTPVRAAGTDRRYEVEKLHAEMSMAS